MKKNAISLLKDGLYEKIINSEFQKQLQTALDTNEIWTEQEDLDPQEAVKGLSSYLQQLIQTQLKELANFSDDDTAESEIAFTNECIRFLFRTSPELGQQFMVALQKSLLLSLYHQKNQISQPNTPRPVTSLSRSFLFTNSQKDINISTELAKEIASSDRIDLLVSFIKFSGLRLIYPALKRFTESGGRLRVITTTYMGATDPRAVIQLSQLPNTEVRVSYDVKETRLHAKAYMFYRNSGYSTAYIGSSNLSHAAIADGLEWNIKITLQDQPHIFDKMEATFDAYWYSQDFTPYSPDQESHLIGAIDHIRHPNQTALTNYFFDIHPYPYQQAILDLLQVERNGKNCWRNLIVAATGTGKTAIAAFDYKRFASNKPHKATHLLFLAHRKEILLQSLDCFRSVLKDPSFGELAVGEYRAVHPEHLFMSIQMFRRMRFWETMSPDYYDMIIVDETHHAASQSYEEAFSYFNPKILLGLTATPERMDGKSILPYFDNHISAEIRLPDAIERRLLCPFHYFGTDDPIDLSKVKWQSGNYDVKELEFKYASNTVSAKRRADAVLRALQEYIADFRDLKCLGFCISKLHAQYMADYMNQHGIHAQNLDADTPPDVRQTAKEKLENGEIQILFVVDLFNEGVDIPSINTVMFLRPTNSLTIFLQQLGRGLRLSEGKDCLTVLDFIAQSNRNYDFSSRFAALLNRKNINIENEIKNGFPHVPKGCCIQLKEIAQKRILDNIRARFRKNVFYIEQIRAFYETTHTIPTLSQFLKLVQIPAEAFFNGTRLYTRLCMEAGLLAAEAMTAVEAHFTKICYRILSIDSPKWLQFLQKEFKSPYFPISPTEKQMLRMWQYTMYGKDYQECGMKTPIDIFTQYRSHPVLAKEMHELLSYLIDRIQILPPKLDVPYPCALEVHCHYTRDQLFAALGYKNPSQIREGVKYLPEKRTDAFLITLNKSSKEFSDTTLYEDYSINSELFHWQTQNFVTPESETGQRYIHQNQNGNIVLLFVRESKQDVYRRAMSYTFLGKAHYVKHFGSRPMTIIYKLSEPIPAQYLSATDSSGIL